MRRRRREGRGEGAEGDRGRRKKGRAGRRIGAPSLDETIIPEPGMCIWIPGPIRSPLYLLPFNTLKDSVFTSFHLQRVTYRVVYV